MAPHVAHVITVEIEQRSPSVGSQRLEANPNVTMLTFDVLRNKNHLRPEVMETVCEKLAQFPNSRFKLVSNLPYNVANPIISNLLLVSPRPERMVVTIQKELADRIVVLRRPAKTTALFRFGCKLFATAKS